MIVKKRLLSALILLLTIMSFIWFQNNSITISQTVIRSENLPANFDQFKIVHLSDLHNKSFGHNQQRLARKINKLQPDIVVFTGDLIDSKRAGDRASLQLMKELTSSVPVYYVSGNHEWWSGKFDALEQSLKAAGVHVLRNEHAIVEKKNEKIYVAGIDDPAHNSEGFAEREIAKKDLIHSLEGMEEDPFTILLTHRPELLSLYATFDLDLVFAGHAHGGQVRLPFIGGVVAPNQGFLPEYTAGRHELDQTQMIVSRGLGNSIIPLRMFNRPEIVAVTLEVVKE
ncbi:phosphoesterase [Sporosarcina sp. P26b]|nr:metallophosphoesterase [Sporosarcina sp. P26b]PIC96831.1 phosphoesterase [Sporosarcina sp. P26b]